MSLFLRSCSMCHTDFDLNYHLPRIIPLCGHRVCIVCLKHAAKTQGRLKCTVDQKISQITSGGLESFPEDASIRLILEKNTKFDICRLHHKTIDLYCFTDHRRICSECSLSNDHNGHSIESLKHIQTKVDQVRSELSVTIDELDDYYRGMEGTLQNKKKELIKEVENHFRDIVLLLENKKEKLCYDIDTMFDNEMQKMFKSFGAASSLKISLNEKLSSLQNAHKSENISVFLDQDVASILKRFRAQISVKNTVHLQAELNNVMKSFCKSLEETKQQILELRIQEDTISRVVNNFYIEAESDLKFLDASSIWSFKDVIEAFEVDRYENELSITPKNFRIKKDYSSLSESNLQKISKLSLNFNESIFSKNLIPSVLYILKQAENIRSIRINFCNTQISGQEALNVCLLTTSWTRGLEEFELLLENSSLNDDNISLILNEVFRSSSELKTLVLNLAQTRAATQTMYKLTKDVLMRTKNLQNLALDLRHTDINDDALDLLRVPCDNIIRLIIHLDFTDIGDLGLSKFTLNNLQSLRHLESFEMRLQSTKVTDKSVSDLISCIKLSKHFSINLNSTAITNTTLEALGKSSLSKSQALESIRINFGLTKITNEGMSWLIFNVDQIKDFYLDLSSTQITDDGLLPFCQSIFPVMKELLIFEINLESTGVTDKSIESLFNPMENLKSFKLHLSSAGISDITLDAFVQKTLNSVKRLEVLELYLYSTHITDRSVSQLFHYMTPVEILKLDLSYTNIRDESIEVFIQLTLPILKELEHLEMNLEGTRVTSKVVCNLLSSLPKLKHITLNLKHTGIRNEKLDAAIEAFISSNASTSVVQILLDADEANSIFSKVNISKKKSLR